ncbi:MAG: YihA family ribosome biogenesis GTP-binding protein [Hahellaceae bacterium]|nr:YihA family ribosome biogenesis GTP-binding protein [Hahellaceae bacterium]MCP5170482.1 YihA family ribosome biogenesis GTP-binding protein [Hahellaceae bacterium]
MNTVTKPSISFNSARFLKSAAKNRDCPPDIGLEVAFAGRSNAGKSSALNAITNNNKLARTSKTPGRTQLLNFFTLNKPERRLVDLPGYGFAKVSRSTLQEWQHHLSDYLNSRESLAGLVLVMDIRNPLKEFDLMMLDWAEHRCLPTTILLTKCDKLSFGAAKTESLKIRSQLKSFQYLAAVIPFSSTAKTGIDVAQKQLESWLMAQAAIELQDDSSEQL